MIVLSLKKLLIYNLWPIIINYQIIFQEDFLITFFILIYAKRYEKIKNILYFHFKNTEFWFWDFFNYIFIFCTINNFLRLKTIIAINIIKVQ